MKDLFFMSDLTLTTTFGHLDTTGDIFLPDITTDDEFDALESWLITIPTGMWKSTYPRFKLGYGFSLNINYLYVNKNKKNDEINVIWSIEVMRPIFYEGTASTGFDEKEYSRRLKKVKMQNI